MTLEAIGLWLLNHVVVPGVAALVGGWFAVGRARRSIRVQRLTEEELRGYEQVINDLKVLRRNAAADIRFLRLRESLPLVNDWSAEEQKEHQRRIESQAARERIRDAEAIGVCDLSEAAVGVLREFLAKADSDDRSDSDGVYYEEDAWAVPARLQGRPAGRHGRDVGYHMVAQPEMACCDRTNPAALLGLEERAGFPSGLGGGPAAAATGRGAHP